MKSSFSIFMLTALSLLLPIACQNPIFTPPPSEPTSTATPTPNCGMTLLTPPPCPLSLNLAPALTQITSQGQWTAFTTSAFPNGAGTPVPTAVPSPVDFSNQMLFLTTWAAPCGGMNPTTITGVCESPNQVEVKTYTDICITCAYCQAVNSCGFIQQMVAVPQNPSSVVYSATVTWH